jgi:type IV secretory pathway VirB2 component (pilin)
MIKKGIPIIIAVTVGLITLLGLLLPATPLGNLGNVFLRWAAFLAAFALLLGVLNLFIVHLTRIFKGSGYSGVLVLSLLTVLVLGFTDLMGITTAGVETAFDWIQAPLEAAFASLLAFFLLFAGFHLLKRRRSFGAVLFIITAVFILLSQALITATFMPAAAVAFLSQTANFIDQVIVTSGMRGLLIGIALGTITLTIRLLTGIERPYNQ